jgi:hypothetical protein
MCMRTCVGCTMWTLAATVSLRMVLRSNDAILRMDVDATSPNFVATCVVAKMEVMEVGSLVRHRLCLITNLHATGAIERVKVNRWCASAGAAHDNLSSGYRGTNYDCTVLHRP